MIINSKITKQKGLAAIEFTMILPFLLLLIFACAEFGRLMFQYNALNKTVRDASRYLNTVNGSNGDLSISDVTSAEVKNLIKFGQNSSSTALFPTLNDDDISLTVSGDFVTVTVTYNWQPIFSNTFSTFGLGDDIDLSFPLVSTYTMRAMY